MISLQLTTQRIHLTVSATALSPLSVPLGLRKLNHYSQDSSKLLAMAIQTIFLT